MKRQHSNRVTSDDLLHLPSVKRPAQTELHHPIQDEGDIHQHLHPASLLRLDLDSLSEVLAHVDLVGLIALCQSSSHRVASILTSCIYTTRFDYQVKSVHLVGGEKATAKSLLTMIRGGCMSRLKSFYLEMMCIDLMHDDCLNYLMPTGSLELRELPPSLTELTLIDVPIDVGRIGGTKHLSNLANLTSLTLNILNVSSEERAHDEISWLVNILAIPTQLLKFDCIFYQNELIRNRALLASALPKTLELLAVDQIMVDHIEHWPPHLTDLRIHFISNWFNDVDDRPKISIPASVTSLTLQKQGGSAPRTLLDGFIKSCFYLADPSTLKHLSFGYTPENWQFAMQAVSKLTSLHSLKLELLFVLDYSEINVKLLPRSLRWLDYEGIIPASQWQYLPPGIQFPRGYRMTSHPICIRRDDSDEQLCFLPKSLKSMVVYNRPLPIELPMLERVVFNLSLEYVSIPPRSMCEVYLVNLPRMLRSITVIFEHCNNLFWLHNDGNNASRFESRFPYLAKFELKLSHTTDVEEGQVQKWFHHLPKTLYTLMIRLGQQSMVGSPMKWKVLQATKFDLSEIVLPRFLQKLYIDTDQAAIGFPEQIPNTLRLLTLRIGRVLNVAPFCNLLKTQMIGRFSVRVGEVMCLDVESVEAALKPQPVQISPSEPLESIV